MRGVVGAMIKSRTQRISSAKGGGTMELKPGDRVKHKLTGQEMIILEVGPKSKKVLLPAAAGILQKEQEYLPAGTVRVRLFDMRVVDVYDYEIVGVDPVMDASGKKLLMES